METTTTQDSSGRRAAVGALAIVGFIVLIIIGIGLAIYTARYLPDIPNKLGGGAVSLSSIFHKKSSSSLQVVTATSTLPFEDTSTTSTSTLSSGDQGAPVPASTVKKPSTGGSGTVTKYVTVTTTQSIDPYGDPDLAVVIEQVGYLRTKGDTNSFVRSTVVPRGKDGAVRFTISNEGTNVTGKWKFEASLPFTSTFTSPYQDSLDPGDSVEYVLGFTRTHSGNDRNITITVDPTDKVSESNENNNEDTATIDLN